ncbi:MAG: transglutaminase-like domain-containing protein [Myxococcota bacterium]
MLKVSRPANGEYFGLYLMGKKVGYFYTHVEAMESHPARARAVNEFVFKASVGSKISERRHKEVRVYEAKVGGRLLSFTVEQQGDGGDQTLEATATPTGLTVLRKRPHQPDEVLKLPPSPETIEDADQVRVAVFRSKNVQGRITDGMDLETYGLSTTLGEPETRTLGGVKVKLSKAVTVSEKEKVPVEAFLDDKGRMVEIQFGATMRAVAESEPVAKRLDQVEVFGLTRVVLPKKLPPSMRTVPGQLTFVMTGLPEKFRKDSSRQTFRARHNDQVEVTVRASPPSKQPAALPLADPSGGGYLKSSIIVESSNEEIRALAQKLVGDETDAYAAAKRIVSWVYRNLEKDYGSSADRATDVLRQKKGDCTEHSLLSVALMRAAGIPAKRVDGVVYMLNDDGVPALYWHEWVGAYVGEWTELDPTFGQDVADATHFAVGEEGNAEITPLIGQLKVLDVH